MGANVAHGKQAPAPAGGPIPSAGGRPRRADVVASYDLGVERYEQLWSPVILPAAASLVPWLGLGGGGVVLDVGGGTGALITAFRSTWPTASVVVVDASWQMLRVAHHRGAPAAQADAMGLPVAAASVDAVVLAYVLFHLADPLAALREAARVVRAGGHVGTVTWKSERTERAQRVWDDAVRNAGVPASPPRRDDTDLDNPDGLRRLLRQAGFLPERVWTEHLHRQWDVESYWALVTGSGVNRQRLAVIDPEARTALLRRVRTDLDRLEPGEFWWEGEVVCAVAAKPPAAARGGRRQPAVVPARAGWPGRGPSPQHRGSERR